MESCLIMETVDLLFSKGQIMSMFINIEKDVLKQYLDAGFLCSYHHFICPRNTHVIRIRHAAPSMPVHKWDIKELQLTVIEENCQMLLFVDLVY